jgi:putative protein-disulfide isomerase
MAVTGPHLVYFVDPMCSWCWGFSPVIAAIRESYGDALPIRVVLGGLRPGTTEPMTEERKQKSRAGWERVRAASGQPFDFSFFERQRFVYDTDPARRAVVLVRRTQPERTLDMLARVQHAFYAENRDVTDPAVLADIAETFGFDPAVFAAAVVSEDARNETWRDYAVSQGAGVTGFPTLIAGKGEGREYAMVTHGFQTADRILPALDRWLQLSRAA